MNDKYEHRPLATRVLAVAVLSEYDWAVYIDSVPGENHENEYMEVARVGAKQSKEVAQVLFPNYTIENYRR